jgi:hypothetical protein
MIVGENDIVLKGAEYWQMDSQFKRSAFISSNGGTSTFMDWYGGSNRKNILTSHEVV